jgi:uroporphyrinogen decarboxylase
MVVENPYGAYEEQASFPLSNAQSRTDVSKHPWPEPDWWDFAALTGIVNDLNAMGEYHIRYRIGSVFEIAWQLFGMEKFMADLVLNPDIPLHIMNRLTEVYVEKTRKVLDIAGDQIDMVYFYDDVATQTSLMISKPMWEKFVKPFHAQIVEVAKSFGKLVMYHCDGAIYPLIPDLIDMGIDMLNPIQADAKGMEPAKLKKEFGDRLSFHGGIDIIDTLPNSTPTGVKDEVSTRIAQLGASGGYILAPSHHIQSNTPIANIRAMYDISLRN